MCIEAQGIDAHVCTVAVPISWGLSAVRSVQPIRLPSHGANGHWQPSESVVPSLSEALKRKSYFLSESLIIAWLTGAAVKQATAKAARSLAECQPEKVIAQVSSLVERSAFLNDFKNAVLRNEIA